VTLRRALRAHTSVAAAAHRGATAGRSAGRNAYAAAAEHSGWPGQPQRPPRTSAPSAATRDCTLATAPRSAAPAAAASALRRHVAGVC
jgi:hypothetical protein